MGSSLIMLNFFFFSSSWCWIMFLMSDRLRRVLLSLVLGIFPLIYIQRPFSLGAAYEVFSKRCYCSINFVGFRMIGSNLTYWLCELSFLYYSGWWTIRWISAFPIYFKAYSTSPDYAQSRLSCLANFFIVYMNFLVSSSTKIWIADYAYSFDYSQPWALRIWVIKLWLFISDIGLFFSSYQQGIFGFICRSLKR